MRSNKSAKTTKLPFTDEQIRAQAHKIWKRRVHHLQQCSEKRTAEDDWKDAIEELQVSWWEKFWRWTGIPEKKGWDLMVGISIPLLLFLGGTLFTYLNNKQQQKIADDKQKDEVLKSYFDSMRTLSLNPNYSIFLKQGIDDSNHPTSLIKKEAKLIARTLTLFTLSTLRQLNKKQHKQEHNIMSTIMSVIDTEDKYSYRKGFVLQFLSESELITKGKGKEKECKNDNPLVIIHLNGADLSYADLAGAHLKNIVLSGIDLSNANLSNASFTSTCLDHTILKEADLSNASYGDFSDANFNQSDLTGANLIGANLNGANLTEANLTEANLAGANLNGVKHLTHAQSKSACNWKKAIYTEANWDVKNNIWIAKDKKSNQREIDKIMKDKSSDPRKPPSCDKYLSFSW